MMTVGDCEASLDLPLNWSERRALVLGHPRIDSHCTPKCFTHNYSSRRSASSLQEVPKDFLFLLRPNVNENVLNEKLDPLQP